MLQQASSYELNYLHCADVGADCHSCWLLSLANNTAGKEKAQMQVFWLCLPISQHRVLYCTDISLSGDPLSTPTRPHMAPWWAWPAAACGDNTLLNHIPLSSLKIGISMYLTPHLLPHYGVSHGCSCWIPYLSMTPSFSSSTVPNFSLLWFILLILFHIGSFF